MLFKPWWFTVIFDWIKVMSLQVFLKKVTLPCPICQIDTCTCICLSTIIRTNGTVIVQMNFHSDIRHQHSCQLIASTHVIGLCGLRGSVDRTHDCCVADRCKKYHCYLFITSPKFNFEINILIFYSFFVCLFDGTGNWLCDFWYNMRIWGKPKFLDIGLWDYKCGLYVRKCLADIEFKVHRCKQPPYYPAYLQLLWFPGYDKVHSIEWASSALILNGFK